MANSIKLNPNIHDKTVFGQLSDYFLGMGTQCMTEAKPLKNVKGKRSIYNRLTKGGKEFKTFGDSLKKWATAEDLIGLGNVGNPVAGEGEGELKATGTAGRTVKRTTRAKKAP